MLKMGMIPILGCVIILASASAGCLINANTPVWVGDRFFPTQPVVYSMQSPNVVLRAIEGWKARKPVVPRVYFLRHPFQYQPSIERRSIHDDQEAVEVRVMNESLKALDENKLSRSKRGVKRDIHVMVAMDYPSRWRIDEPASSVDEQIVYAVAFWNGFHQHIKRIKDRRYNIHIVGIIIAAHKEAVPYLRENEKDGYVDSYGAITAMEKYWKELEPKKSGHLNFPLDGRQLLVTMTEARQKENHPNWIIGNRDGRNNMIYFDTLVKDGMQDFNLITLKGLLDHWSRADFKDYGHPSGKGITFPPLPGEIILVEKQCEAWNNDSLTIACISLYNGEHPCWSLRCKPLGIHYDAGCDRVSESIKVPALDGTYCKSGGVCLRGKCVRRRSVKYDQSLSSFPMTQCVKIDQFGAEDYDHNTEKYNIGDEDI